MGLAIWDYGIVHITNSVRPIAKPEDLKGLRIGGSFDGSSSFVSQFGATSFGSVEKTYSELQKKRVNGQVSTIDYVFRLELYKLQKYLSLTGHSYRGWILTCKKEMFDKLPNDFQNILINSAAECARLHREAVREKEIRQLSVLTDKGMHITNPERNKFRELCASEYFKNRDKKSFSRGEKALIEEIFDRR